MISLSNITAEKRLPLLRLLLDLLEASRYRKASTWRGAVVVIARGAGAVHRVASRTAFASHLAERGQHEAASECRERQLGPREVLVWVEGRRCDGEVEDLMVVNFPRELEALKGSTAVDPASK